MIKKIYQIVKPLLFSIDPEKAHHLSMNLFRALIKSSVGAKWIRSQTSLDAPSLSQDIMGLRFKNPIGLAAGFDKDGKYLDCLANMGFGCAEIGTVTPRPQLGNEKPRLFRLPKDRALINRMGFNNEGVDALVKRLKVFNKPPSFIIGGNIGKNKDTPNEDAHLDYLQCFKALYNYVDYFVVNVSSPNTPGLRDLQNVDSLHKILSTLNDYKTSQQKQRPILLKIAPDLSPNALDEVCDLINQLDIAGIVSSNTSIRRDLVKNSHSEMVKNIGNGGLSGAPIFDLSNEVLSHIRMRLDKGKVIISVGGVEDPQTAMKKFELGADLVQVYSGMIFYGPTLVRDILVQILSKKNKF